MKKQLVSFVVDGIMSGIFLCIGCAVSICSDSKFMGAFLFSLGLFAIINFHFGLYTGKAGYMAVKPPKYILEVVITLLSNIVGTAIGGTLLRMTRFGDMFTEKASSVIGTKFSDTPISIFVLAIFCGILMFTAVDGNKRASKNGNFVGSLFFVVMPVIVFILCGFNHCVADMAYFFISGCSNISSAPMYFILVILGNAVGCMLIPFAKMFSENK